MFGRPLKKGAQTRKGRIVASHRFYAFEMAILLVLMTLFLPDNARANEYPNELLLGVFTQSRQDSTDMFYISRDGVHMELIVQHSKMLLPNLTL